MLNLTLFDAGLDLFLDGGFLYLPLLYDPAVAQEIGWTGPCAPISPVPEPAASGLLRYADGQAFLKSLVLSSLVDNYPCLFPEYYEAQRKAFWRRQGFAVPPPGTCLNPKLKVILFEILPHFLRRRPSASRAFLDPGAVLDRLAPQVTLIPEYPPLPSGSGLVQQLDRLRQDLGSRPPQPPAGRCTGAHLQAWLHQAIAGPLIAAEQTRLAREQEAEGFLQTLTPQQRAVLAAIAAQGELEIDGFGFQRLPHRDDYLVFKRTGLYALRDAFGRPYLFPDARVAVSTAGPLMPVVLENYKHPLLMWHKPRQPICIKDFQPPTEFSASQVIAALDQGLNALYHGYNYRRQNGYHSLEQLRREFAAVTFDDYRIPLDHELLACGRVEIKNDFF